MIDEAATDVLRVAVALPVFGYAAYRDVIERRVRHHVWLPAVAAGLIALAADLVLRDTGETALLAGVSLAFGAAFGYGFYYLGTFGGADRYALVVIALVFPVYPAFEVLGTTYPRVVPDAPVFVLTVLGNTVVVGALYPVSLLFRNLRRRDLDQPLLLFLGKKVAVDDLVSEYGRIVEGPEGVSLGRSGVVSSHGGVTDVDLVHDLVEWHAVDRPSEIQEPRLAEFVEQTAWESDDVEADEAELDWLLGRDEVWISPGIPFVVPILAGIVVGLTYGDVLFTAMQPLLR